MRPEKRKALVLTSMYILELLDVVNKLQHIALEEANGSTTGPENALNGTFKYMGQGKV
jgi:hypothetical protein